NTDSKLVRAYDDAIERAQVDPDGHDADRQDGQTSSDEIEPDPNANWLAATLHQTGPDTELSELAGGDELRDREFPVPTALIQAGSQRLLVDQDTISDDESRRGGWIGTREGDRQNLGDVPSCLDQDAVAPDLEQEQR